MGWKYYSRLYVWISFIIRWRTHTIDRIPVTVCIGLTNCHVCILPKLSCLTIHLSNATKQKLVDGEDFVPIMCWYYWIQNLISLCTLCASSLQFYNVYHKKTIDVCMCQRIKDQVHPIWSTIMMHELSDYPHAPG